MKPNLIALIFISFIISACSSDIEQKTRYYLLDSPTSQSAKSTIKPVHSPLIIIRVAELPKYLTHASLVMQLSEHQLHYSHFHMWAEPLSHGLSSVIAKDLNQLNAQFQFSNYIENIENVNARVVVIHIDNFHISHQATALITGFYQVRSLSGDVETIPFDYRTKLEQDGYAHAVEKLRVSAAKLSADINQNLY